MTGNFLFDWLLLALSLFNCVVLLWLGLTVMLNAERRALGVWLIGGAAFLGCLFFAAHTAILSMASQTISSSVNFWWEIGWVPLLALPYAWYGIVLWYGGFSLRQDSPLRRRHQVALWVMGLCFLLLVGLLLVAAPLPSFSQVITLQFAPALVLWGVPWFFLVYPVYIFVCLALAFDAVRRPGPALSAYAGMGRERARPWLQATTVLLLIVSLLVAGTIAWIGSLPRPVPVTGDFPMLAYRTAWLDLAISGLIVGVNILIGQAIVHYEVFSGRVLPRRELRRQWRNGLILAAGYAIVVGGALSIGLLPIYSLLLTALLMMLFYALLGWRSYARHEEFMRQLRPFVASMHLYDQLTALPARSPTGDEDDEPRASRIDTASSTLAALCERVLNTNYAALVATGALGTLVAEPLVHPATSPAPGSGDWPADLDQAPDICVPVHVQAAPAAAWAVPLFSGRGLIGVLFVGERRDGGMFTQEEVEIARATGERLIDLRAGAQLAQRLLDVQRQRMVESTIVDRQTRRMLHDEVLPELHTALLLLNQGTTSDPVAASALLSRAHRHISDLLHALPVRPALRPGGSLLDELRQLVEVELAAHFDSTVWQATPAAQNACAALSPVIAEVVYYAVREAIRNAARHVVVGSSGGACSWSCAPIRHRH